MMKKPVPSDMRKPFFVLDENARGMREIAMPLKPHAMPAARLRAKVVSPVISSSVTVRSSWRDVVAVILGGRPGARA